MNNRLTVFMAALAVGWVGACRSEVRPSDVVDAAQFEAVHRTGQTVKTAVEAGVTFPGYRQTVQAFADQVVVARGAAQNEQERRIAALYDKAVAGYADALTVWGVVNHMIPAVMRVDHDAVAYAQRSEFRRNDDSLLIPDGRRTPQVVAIVARYNIPTITTNNGNAVSVATSLTVVWDAADHDFDAANKALEAAASGRLH